MANKVCCDEIKVQSTLDMNDRDYLNDLLYNEKSIVVNTATAITEASNDKLKDEIFKFLETVEQIQRETYELAWNNGWYVLEEAEKTKINQKDKELTKKLDELSNKSN